MSAPFTHFVVGFHVLVDRTVALCVRQHLGDGGDLYDDHIIGLGRRLTHDEYNCLGALIAANRFYPLFDGDDGDDGDDDEHERRSPYGG